jgi:hypothetical protein
MAVHVHRWYRVTTDRALLFLLFAELMLWVSDRFAWPAWHKGYAVLTCVAATGAAIVAILLSCLVEILLRRRLQIGVRTAALLAIAVAIPVSWMVTTLKKADDEKKTAETAMKWGAVVSFDWQIDGVANDLTDPTPPAPGWLRAVFGDYFFGTVSAMTVAGNGVTDADLKTLAELPHLRKLSLGYEIGFEPRPTVYMFREGFGGHITDDGLQYLGSLTSLQQLNLSERGELTDAGFAQLRTLSRLRKLWLHGTCLTDRGLEYLKPLRQLRELNIAHTAITDKGLAHVRSFTELNVLLLSGNNISDGGLNQLKTLQNLKELDLRGARVSDEGVARLQKALPGCSIHK